MKRAVLVAIGLTLFLGAVLFRVWVHRDAVIVGYELAAQMRRGEALRDTAQKLELELAAQRSPERLKRMAQNLGMEPPAPGAIFGAAEATR